MSTPGHDRVRFADDLLGALGLNSVTIEEGENDSPDTLGQTGIYGRSHYSLRNRAGLLRALEGDPGPRTLAELSAAVHRCAGERGKADYDELLPAVRRAAEHDPERVLTDFVGAR